MPIKHFICPDGGQIQKERCLSKKGCRLKERCATLPYLRAVSYERSWTGRVTPSMAGTGARKIWLENTVDYAISPASRIWASQGSATHDKLSVHKLTDNVLSEEALGDEKIKGILDVLEEDENETGKYVLYDYKNWGSFKTKMALGISTIKKKIKDDRGEYVRFKSGERKGQIKTKAIKKQEITNGQILSETYQLNMYRIMCEQAGFPISKIKIQVIPRDGGIKHQLPADIILIDIPIIDNWSVHKYYNDLQTEVGHAFKSRNAPKCGKWESWNGRRCNGFCDVEKACKQLL